MIISTKCPNGHETQYSRVFFNFDTHEIILICPHCKENFKMDFNQKGKEETVVYDPGPPKREVPKQEEVKKEEVKKDANSDSKHS